MIVNTVIYTCIIFLLILAGITLFLLLRIKHFRMLSETDQMTSLMNYRGLYRNIEKLLRSKTPFILAIIDIDNFRIFNEKSYKLGDTVLKEFAALLHKSFAEEALIARFRIGDEFVIVFRATEPEKAKIRIKQFKETCNAYKFNCLTDFNTHTISFSEGLVEVNSKIISIDMLFSEAEAALKTIKTTKDTYK